MKSTLYLTVAALTASVVFAQGQQGNRGNPPDPATMVQRRVQMLTRWLDLTADQQTQATAIFTNSANAGQDARTKMQDARTQLAAAIKANNIGTIDQISTTIGGLEGQLTGIQAKADASFYAILTVDQKAKYDQMGARGMGMGPMGGPGRFGGRGRE
jgi:Spy/CpxP family protein refolding chaperone